MYCERLFMPRFYGEIIRISKQTFQQSSLFFLVYAFSFLYFLDRTNDDLAYLFQTLT